MGYAVRFDDRTTPRTVVKYVTDGVLLREAMADPLLRAYAVIVLGMHVTYVWPSLLCANVVERLTNHS